MSHPYLVGRPFVTRCELPDEPAWEPLAGVARMARLSPDLPAFHEGEFMYMAMVRNARKRLTIHLYKHIDTRCYLNLDDGGHAYAYRGSAPDDVGDELRGRYQLYRSLVDAIDAVELWLFDDEPPLFRSFPPSKWPRERDTTAAT
jgi:hypothetical protein